MIIINNNNNAIWTIVVVDSFAETIKTDTKLITIILIDWACRVRERLINVCFVWYYYKRVIICYVYLFIRTLGARSNYYVVSSFRTVLVKLIH